MSFSFSIFSVLIAIILVYVPHFIRAVLWRRLGIYDNKNPRGVQAKMAQLPPEKADLLMRLGGAHNNQLETIGMYAAAIVANIARLRDDWQLKTLAAVYIALRTAYIMLYIGPPVLDGNLRTLCFMGVLTVISLTWIKAML